MKDNQQTTKVRSDFESIQSEQVYDMFDRDSIPMVNRYRPFHYSVKETIHYSDMFDRDPIPTLLCQKDNTLFIQYTIKISLFKCCIL